MKSFEVRWVPRGQSPNAVRYHRDYFPDKLQCMLTALDGITETRVGASARMFDVSGTVRER